MIHGVSMILVIVMALFLDSPRWGIITVAAIALALVLVLADDKPPKPKDQQQKFE